MRKRILSACAALIFMTTATLSAYAEGEREYLNPEDGAKGTIGITYSVDPTYTVEIPQKITLSKTEPVEDSIKVSNVNIPAGNAVLVVLEDAEENYYHCVDDEGRQFALCVRMDNRYVFGKGSPVLEYELSVVRGTADPVPVYVNDVIEAFTKDGEVGLKFSPPYVYDDPADDGDDYYKQYAGTYSAILTFGIRIEEGVQQGQWI